jgi:hypothetical protein
LVSVGFLGPVEDNKFHLANCYLEWRDRQTPFQSMTSTMPGGLCDLDTPAPRQVNCIRVESNFLKTLGIAPALGRDFTPEEDRFNRPRLALASFGLWQDAFGANPVTVGPTVDLDEQAVRIIGILPAGFKMPQGADPDILLLEQWDARFARAPDSTVFLGAFARLKDGVSIEQARERLQPLFQDSGNKYVPGHCARKCGWWCSRSAIARSTNTKSLPGCCWERCLPFYCWPAPTWRTPR